MRVLIAGCGYIGVPLGLLLAARGDTVYGLKRKPESLPTGIAPIAADLKKPEQLTALPAVDAIVYAASAGRGGKSAYQSIYRDGLQNIVNAYKGTDVSRLIFVSSTAVYGQDSGQWVDETTPTTPERFSGRILLEAETVAHRAPIPSIALRLGGIYGPGRTRTIEGVRNGTTVCAEGIAQYLNHIHRDDCAGVLNHLLHLEKPTHVYLGVDDAPEDRAVMLDWIADALGVPHPPRVSPDEMPSGRGSNKRCSNRLLKESGYVFTYPTYREGYAALIERSP